MQNGHLATQQGQAGTEKREVTQLEDLHSWFNPVTQPLSDLLKSRKRHLVLPVKLLPTTWFTLTRLYLEEVCPFNGSRAHAFLGKHWFTPKEHPFNLLAYLDGEDSAKQAGWCRVGDWFTGTLCNDIPSVCTKSLWPFFPLRSGLKWVFTDEYESSCLSKDGIDL